MRILYIARHGQRSSNDDEGAIAHALRVLGHEVECVHENADVWTWPKASGADLILCHHWQRPDLLLRRDAPTAFWCFDLIDYPSDPTLAVRCSRRKIWAEAMTDACDIGFFTDGDHVAKDTTGKLHWLMQGADERVVGRGTVKTDIPILFTGSENGGHHRLSFVEEMRTRYGPNFVHVTSGVHGRAMADLITGARVVVAPDAPVTDLYHSNRIYNVCGFGGYLVHPRNGKALEDYKGCGVDFYESREHLHYFINLYRQRTPTQLRDWALEHTKTHHLYRHRCEQLIKTVKENLHI